VRHECALMIILNAKGLDHVVVDRRRVRGNLNPSAVSHRKAYAGRLLNTPRYPATLPIHRFPPHVHRGGRGSGLSLRTDITASSRLASMTRIMDDSVERARADLRFIVGNQNRRARLLTVPFQRKGREKEKNESMNGMAITPMVSLVGATTIALRYGKPFQCRAQDSAVFPRSTCRRRSCPLLARSDARTAVATLVVTEIPG